METVTDFIFLGSKNTLDSDCSQEIKTLVLWKKSYDKPKQCIKSRDITLPTKICIVKAMVFPVVMYACESWTIKKAEHQIIDAFELWCWKRLLGVPWTARRSNQSILKEISPEYSLEELMLKLKLQYFWPPAVKSWLIGKDPDAGEAWGQEEKVMTEDKMAWWYHWLNGHEFEQASGDGEGQGSLACCSPWVCKESDVTELLNDNTFGFTVSSLLCIGFSLVAMSRDFSLWSPLWFCPGSLLQILATLSSLGSPPLSPHSSGSAWISPPRFET